MVHPADSSTSGGWWYIRPYFFRWDKRLCYTRVMAEVDWIREIQARGWGDVLSAALDILEPLGPLGAQMLWVAQPAAHLIGGWGDSFAVIAQALEEPGGIERLRQMLDEDHENEDNV